MDAVRSAIPRFFGELKRRHVFRAAAAYAVVAWLVVQVSDTVFPYLHLPSWAVTLVIALTLLGFPLALVLAWAYDITPDGVHRTAARASAPDRSPAAPAPPGNPGGAVQEARADVGSRAEAAPAAGASGRTRLIVLPFRMLRPDAETDFLALSLPDAISSSLAGIRSLVVRSQLAALRFTGSHDLRAIAVEAGVDVVLSGTLVRAGEQLRVSVQLTGAHDGTLLWTQTSQVSIGDLFLLQDQLTQRIVESLNLPLSSRERGILTRDVPATPRAYEFFLRANRVAYEVGQWGLARDLYLQSLEEDPNFAPTLARLGRCYRLIAKWSATDTIYQQNLEAAEAMFQRALEANPDLPIAQNLYAQLEVELGRAEDAMVRLVRQAHASAGDAQLFAGLVHALRFCGLLDASAAAHRRARALDPQVTTSVAHTFFMLGDYERVLGETFGDIGYIAPLALASLGREDEALAMLRAHEQSADHVSVRPYLTSLRALLEGERDESLAAMKSIIRRLRDPEGLHYMARQLAYMHAREEAVTCIERIVESGFFCFPFLSRDPWLDGIRANPRFRWTLQQAEKRHREAEEIFRKEGGAAVLDPAGSLANPATVAVPATHAM
jgi:eukaryotic-like serine/threonine-protein kinase